MILAILIALYLAMACFFAGVCFTIYQLDLSSSFLFNLFQALLMGVSWPYWFISAAFGKK